MDEKKRKIWALVLKVLAAALTALTGALTSCALLNCPAAARGSRDARQAPWRRACRACIIY